MHFDLEQVKMFRILIARTNIAYHVVTVKKERKRQEVEAIVLKAVQQKLRKYKQGKVVVYSNSVPKVKALAEKLHCQAYHHNAVGKASMLDAFMEGRQHVIVATSALGIGVDVPDIWCIIHIDWLSRFWSLFLVPRTTVSCLHCCTTKYVSHHWSTPHCCSPTYTIYIHIQYQLSSILQFFLHTRCFPTATSTHIYSFLRS
jgi:hypothetical protein